MTWRSIAVDGVVIDHADGSLISGGAFIVTSDADSKVEAEGKGAYFGSIVFTFSGGSADGYDTDPITGAGLISGGGSVIGTGLYV